MSQVNPSPNSLLSMETLLRMFMGHFCYLKKYSNLRDTRFVVVGDLAELPYELYHAHRYQDHNVETSGTIVLLIEYEERIESIKNALKERWPDFFHLIDSQLYYDSLLRGFIMAPVHLIPLDRLGLGQNFDRECGLTKIAEVGNDAPRIPWKAITEQLRTAVGRYGVTWSAERIMAALQASKPLPEPQGSQRQESGLDEIRRLDNPEDSSFVAGFCFVAGLCLCLPWIAGLWP
ncbi:uncharacterized protein BO66DRAFT_441224 [Aspergillus aculeatinus CBS 121060]|uniref:Uncharacterized protein n=1 Tax=Aspergillus aculeatinus CBS 121060 TaxID=1448322 RepID=A0ACD1H0Y7_9EURO|nr:hypothetical protein BO66DRAFT_441224 [Aspergillus aculeatinus CBS 121060]RAH67260.1 hypothetical protein BO66DRAFT_441224 [Aspergillus aculeatinus CBS 121060]